MIKGNVKPDKSEYLQTIDEYFGIEEHCGKSFLSQYSDLMDFVGKKIIEEEQKIHKEKQQYKIEYENSMSLEEELFNYSYSFGFRENSLKAIFLMVHSEFESSLKHLCYLIHKFKPSSRVFDFHKKDGDIDYYLAYLKSRRDPTSDILTKNEKKSLNLFRGIRNALTHSNFILPNSTKNEKLIQYCLGKTDSIKQDYFYTTENDPNSYYKFTITKSTFIKEVMLLYKKVFDAAISVAKSLD